MTEPVPNSSIKCEFVENQTNVYHVDLMSSTFRESTKTIFLRDAIRDLIVQTKFPAVTPVIHMNQVNTIRLLVELTILIRINHTQQTILFKRRNFKDCYSISFTEVYLTVAWVKTLGAPVTKRPSSSAMLGSRQTPWPQFPLPMQRQQSVAV